MKINRQEFVEVLNIVAPAVGQNAMVPAFQCFQIDGDEVVATDGVMVIRAKFTEDTGLHCAIPAPQFRTLLSGMRAKEIDLEDDGEGHLVVKTVKGSIKGTFTTIANFSPLAVPTCELKTMEDDFKGLIAALSFCRYSTSKDEANGPYCGVRITGTKVYSTDKYRVARYEIGEQVLTEDATVPVKFVVILLKHKNSIAEMGIEDGRVLIVKLKNGTLLYTGLLEGEYRDLEEYFPTDMDGGAVVEFPEELSEILGRQIEYLKNVDATNMLTNIKIVGNICTLTSVDKELGKLTEDLELAVSQKDEIEFDINPLFLREVVEVSNTFTYNNGKILFSAGGLSYLVPEAV